MGRFSHCSSKIIFETTTGSILINQTSLSFLQSCVLASVTSFINCHGIFISEKSSCTNTHQKRLIYHYNYGRKYYMFQRATFWNTIIINHLLLLILIGKPFPNHSHSPTLSLSAYNSLIFFIGLICKHLTRSHVY